MVQEHELVPGVQVAALGETERLVVGAVRLIGVGRGQCPALARAFDDRLGVRGGPTLKGLRNLATLLPAESARKLTLGWLCVRGLTWDEAAILALLEAAQRADAGDMGLWFARLGVASPSRDIRRAAAWAVAAFVISGKGVDPSTAHLTRSQPSRTIRIRDQIESQIGPLD